MKKLFAVAIIVAMLVLITGCSNEEPTRENNYNTTIEEAEFVERILEETIIEENIIEETIVR